MATVGEALFVLEADATQFIAALEQAGVKVVQLQTKATGLGTTAGMAGPGVRRLQNAVTALGFGLAGVPGPLGRVASLLSGFAVGGALTAGVVAGIGLIALAWDRVGKAAERARTAHENVLEAIRGAAPPEADLTLEDRLALAQDLLIGAQARLRAEDRRTTVRHTVRGPSGALEQIEREISLGDPARVREYTQEVAAAQRMVDRTTTALRAQRAEGDRLVATFREIEQAMQDVAAAAAQLTIPTPLIPAFPNNADLGRVRRGAGPGDILGPQIDALKDAFRGPNDQANAALEETMRDAAKAAQANPSVTSAYRDLGAALAGALTSEIAHAMAPGGRFDLGSLLRTVASAAIGVLVSRGVTSILDTVLGVSPAPSPVAGAMSSPLDLGRMPAAANPLAAARDQDWQAWLRESARVATAQGFRFG